MKQSEIICISTCEAKYGFLSEYFLYYRGFGVDEENANSPIIRRQLARVDVDNSNMEWLLFVNGYHIKYTNALK